MVKKLGVISFAGVILSIKTDGTGIVRPTIWNK